MDGLLDHGPFPPCGGQVRRNGRAPLTARGLCLQPERTKLRIDERFVFSQRAHRLGRPAACAGLFSGRFRPLLRPLRGAARRRSRRVSDRRFRRQSGPVQRAALRDDDRRAAAARRRGDGGLLPPAHRPHRAAAPVLVAGAAAALLRLSPHLRRRYAEPDGRSGVVYRAPARRAPLYVRLQLQLRHHAAVVSLYARGALPRDAGAGRMAAAGFAARSATLPGRVGRGAAAALRRGGGTAAGLCGQRRQHGAVGRLRLERLRDVLLFFGLRRLSGAGLLSGALSLAVELAADARRDGAALRGRLPYNGAGLRRHAEPVSG